MHSSPVPVALAPEGYNSQDAITRITCATGFRQGSDALLDIAIEEARARRVPLRLMSLVALKMGNIDKEHIEAIVQSAQQHADQLTEQAKRTLPEECSVTKTVGSGESAESAIRSLDFSKSEIVFVGSSRLARSRQLFLGQSANKMLRELPVPMIVIPRDYKTID